MFTAHRKGVVAIGNDKGEILWSMSESHPQQADISADGKRIFVSFKNGARMIDMASKKELWRYECPSVVWQGKETSKLKKGDKIQLENPVAQILGRDRFLVGNEGLGMLLEIDCKGKVLKTIKSESLVVVNHGEFRLAHKTKDGKYVFPMLASSLLTVYDSKGKQLTRINTQTGVVSCQVLKDKSLLAGGLFGIEIFNKKGKKIWSFSSKELQKQLGSKAPIVICDVKMLSNKNILCTTYGGKDIPDILEVSMKKSIVKKIDFPEYTHFSSIKLLDKNLKPLK